MSSSQAAVELLRELSRPQVARHALISILLTAGAAKFATAQPRTRPCFSLWWCGPRHTRTPQGPSTDLLEVSHRLLANQKFDHEPSLPPARMAENSREFVSGERGEITSVWTKAMVPLTRQPVCFNVLGPLV